MPLRRSPPPAVPGAPPATAAAYASQSYDSDTPSERSGSGNVCVRTKRRREEEDIHALRVEMRDLFSTLSDNFNKRFKEIIQQNNELKTSLTFLSEQYHNVIDKIHKLEEERLKEKNYVIVLENRMEILERKLKASGIEIRNVPRLLKDPKGIETKEDMCILVKNLGLSVQEDIQEYEIADIYRTNARRDQNAPIILELKSALKKEKILQAVKQFNKSKSKDEKLNTGHLKMTGPNRPVYVSEALTFRAQKLFHMAREFAREYKYTYCWTSKGQVYIRKNDNLPVYRIDAEEAILKLKQSI